MHSTKQIGPAENANDLVVIQHRDDPLIPFDHMLLDLVKWSAGCGRKDIPEHDVLDRVGGQFVIEGFLYRFPCG